MLGPEMDVIVEDLEGETTGEQLDVKDETERKDDNEGEEVVVKEEQVKAEMDDSDEEDSLFPDTTIQLQHIHGDK